MLIGPRRIIIRFIRMCFINRAWLIVISKMLDMEIREIIREMGIIIREMGIIGIEINIKDININKIL